jgi:2-dehydro-3-deoxygluconokinase
LDSGTVSGPYGRPADEVRFDVVALGEVMLRLDPGEGRIRTAREFRIWEGGGEYNVARGLRRCFDLRAGIVTTLVDNEIGRLVEDLILQGGVDTSLIGWRAFDGVGREARNGLNFVERGYGVRGALGVSDRGHTAISQLRPGDIDWHDLFGVSGARCLHCGGIFAALSQSAADVAEEAMIAARRHGTLVSYDSNFRPSLWLGAGGLAAARELDARLLQHADIAFGVGPADGDAAFELTPEGAQAAREAIGSLIEEHPNVTVAAATLRTVHAPSVNDWGAVAWDRTAGFAEARPRFRLSLLDRIGGGDSFVSGLLYGLLERGDLQQAVELGAAHGALAMTTPGDASMATLADVERLVGAREISVRR